MKPLDRDWDRHSIELPHLLPREGHEPRALAHAHSKGNSRQGQRKVLPAGLDIITHVHTHTHTHLGGLDGSAESEFWLRVGKL